MQKKYISMPPAKELNLICTDLQSGLDKLKINGLFKTTDYAPFFKKIPGQKFVCYFHNGNINDNDISKHIPGFKDLQLNKIQQAITEQKAQQFIDQHRPWNHSIRLAIWMTMTSREMYPDQPAEMFVSNALGSIYHDCGKIYVSRELLLKKGKYTDEEMAIVMQHAVASRRVMEALADTVEYNALEVLHLDPLPPNIKFLLEVLHSAAESGFSHHEHFDGSGYPLGKCFYDLPPFILQETMMDVWDAMLDISRSFYRPENRIFTVEDVIKEELLPNQGTKYSPEWVDCLLDIVARKRPLIDLILEKFKTPMPKYTQ